MHSDAGRIVVGHEDDHDPGPEDDPEAADEIPVAAGQGYFG